MLPFLAWAAPFFTVWLFLCRLRLTARKKHSSFSSTSANTPGTDDSVASGMCTVGTQTDRMVESMKLQAGSGEGYRKVQTASKEVQTEPVKISPVEDNAKLVENLLTPSSRLLIVSLPLKYFSEIKFIQQWNIEQCTKQFKVPS